MASLDEMPFKIRVFLTTYPWRRIDPPAWAPLPRPLSECRLGLVTSGGLSMPDQPPFDETVKGGDWSYRWIPLDAKLPSLVESHKSDAFDHRGLAADRNLALPLDRGHELVAAGRLGELNRRHLSFMGSITAPGRLIAESAPEAAAGFVADGVDVALLVPV
ncbi:MAG TPA: glycine/sarcosine/betaine reductase selenoprotein B family protein [Thermoanaerobaculia bacterium]|nr:glycine/sarcosine/betaine reductase selenoprotein B family protein [Thermoanaerobaculia bacterium]